MSCHADLAVKRQCRDEAIAKMSLQWDYQWSLCHSSGQSLHTTKMVLYCKLHDAFAASFGGEERPMGRAAENESHTVYASRLNGLCPLHYIPKL